MSLDVDDNLLSYALIHCRTERALFHRDHVMRILKLAGRALPTELLPEFISVDSETMVPLVKEAREKLQAGKNSKQEEKSDMPFTARASKTQDDIVIEIPVQNGNGSVLQLRLTLDRSRDLRRSLESAERDIERRMSARGEHPIY